jgi:hypothetical protein
MRYTEEVGARFSAGINAFSNEACNKIHRSFKEYTAEWGSFVAAAKAILEEIRADYCCGRLAFYLARHFQLAAQEDKPGVYLQKNAEQYARALNNLGDQSRTILDKQFWEKRFLYIFTENLFLLPSGEKRPVTKQDVLDVCRYLGMTIDDAERMLLSVLENEGFSCLNSSDLVEMFLLQVQGANENTREELKEFCLTHRKKARRKETTFAAGKTRQLASRFEMRLSRLPHLTNLQEACCKFKEWILEEDDLDMLSTTAQSICQKLLVYIEENMTVGLPKDGMALEENIFKKILSAVNVEYVPQLIRSDNKTDDDIIFEEIRSIINQKDVPLLTENKIMEIVFCATEQAGADTEYVGKSWSYPTLDESGRLVWSKAQSRLADILRGKLSPQKNDLLFILYRAYVMKLETIQDPECSQKRYADFIELANMILKKAFLPPFYPPHILECAIGQSLLSGDLADDLFRDLVDGILDAEASQQLHVPSNKEKTIKRKKTSKRGPRDSLTKHLGECAQKKLPPQSGIGGKQYTDITSFSKSVFHIWSEKFAFDDIALDLTGDRAKLYAIKDEKRTDKHVQFCDIPQSVQDIVSAKAPVMIQVYSKWVDGNATTADALIDIYLDENKDTVMTEAKRSVQHKKIALSIICAQMQKAYKASSKFKLEKATKSFSAYPLNARITIAPPKNKN